MFCRYCRKEIDRDVTFCKYCGGKIAEKDVSQTTEQLASSTDDIRLFVRENQDYYARKWNRMGDNRISWNFVALFFPFPWLGYRKMYRNALFFALAFLVLDIFLYYFIPGEWIASFATIGLWIFLGAFGNFFYKQHTIKKLHIIRGSNMNDDQKYNLIKKKGGTSWLGVIFAIFIFIFVYALPATVLLPEVEEDDIPPMETKEVVTPIEWDSYENKRFGFIVKHPTEWGKGKESENRDGVIFNAGTDNQIMVFATIFDGKIDIPDTGITEEIQTENGIPAIVNRTEQSGKVIYEMSLLDGAIEYHLSATLTLEFAKDNAAVLREMIRHFEVTEGEGDTLPMDNVE